MKRVRRDAKLKALPIDRQGEVIRVLDEVGITPAALPKLKEIGIEVKGIATLSRFRAWYDEPLNRAAREMEAAGSVTQFILDHARKEGPKLSQEELFQRGQVIFSELAIAMRDPKTWFMAQTVHRDRERVDLKRDELDLAERKFRRETCELFIKWAEDQRAREAIASGSTQTEKIEALGKVMFGESWDEGE